MFIYFYKVYLLLLTEEREGEWGLGVCVFLLPLLAYFILVSFASCSQGYDTPTGYDMAYFRTSMDEQVQMQGLPYQEVNLSPDFFIL